MTTDTTSASLPLRVADALVRDHLSTEDVLRAADARSPKPFDQQVDFTTTDPHWPRGTLALDRERPGNAPPESVDLMADSAAPPIALAAVAALFGSWHRAPTTGFVEPWAVVFEQSYPPADGRTRRRVAVRVDAVLSGDPGDPGTRITRLSLIREVGS